MLRIGGIMILALFMTQGRPDPGKINSTSDKTAAFSTFTTYGWITVDPTVGLAAHKAIVSAIDAEMTALGLKQVEGRTGDVTVRYLAVRSTDVDLKKLEALQKQGGDETGAHFSVGRLVIIIDDAKSSRRLWAADGMERLNPDPADLDRTIAAMVARMFATYPTRQKRK